MRAIASAVDAPEAVNYVGFRPTRVARRPGGSV
jgi:hypothetical protein